MSSYKNTKICYLPDHVIIRDIDNVLDTHQLTTDAPDSRIKNRIDRSLDVLLEYTAALSEMRKHSTADLMQHAHGM